MAALPAWQAVGVALLPMLSSKGKGGQLHIDGYPCSSMCVCLAVARTTTHLRRCSMNLKRLRCRMRQEGAARILMRRCASWWLPQVSHSNLLLLASISVLLQREGGKGQAAGCNVRDVP